MHKPQFLVATLTLSGRVRDEIDVDFSTRHRLPFGLTSMTSEAEMSRQTFTRFSALRALSYAARGGQLRFAFPVSR
jgi:hypothetical protein